MSGSYDRPPGPHRLPAPEIPRARQRADAPRGPAGSSPAAGTDGYGDPDLVPGYTLRRPSGGAPLRGPDEMYSEPYMPPELDPALLEPPDEHHDAGARARLEPVSSTGPVVPAGSVTGRSLTLVVSIMCFLACLTVGAVYMINQSAAAWLRDIASEVTVQIEAREKVDGERLVRDVSAFLAKQQGIKTVKPLSLEDSAALIEPWLGTSDGLRSLPVPRLIGIEVERASPPDFEALRQRLASEFKGVTLDDHRRWQAQIRTVTHSLGLAGLAILLLVGAATTAVIISATRSAMASNREIVEVLHLVGATDRFIAREFEKHFLRLGVRAGLVGALSAMGLFWLMPVGMEFLGGGAVTMAELRRLFGAGVLDMSGYGVLSGVVVVIAALCMVTSRFSVYRFLHTQH